MSGVRPRHPPHRTRSEPDEPAVADWTHPPPRLRTQAAIVGSVPALIWSLDHPIVALAAVAGFATGAIAVRLAARTRRPTGRPDPSAE